MVLMSTMIFWGEMVQAAQLYFLYSHVRCTALHSCTSVQPVEPRALNCAHALHDCGIFSVQPVKPLVVLCTLHSCTSCTPTVQPVQLCALYCSFSRLQSIFNWSFSLIFCCSMAGRPRFCAVDVTCPSPYLPFQPIQVKPLSVIERKRLWERQCSGSGSVSFGPPGSGSVSLSQKAGPGSGSGSVGPRCGPEDPDLDLDLYQNVMDPEHWRGEMWVEFY